MGVLVTPASVQDRKGGMMLFDQALEETPSLCHLWADSAYTGMFARHVRRAQRSLDIVRRSDDRLHGAWRDEQLPLIKVKPRFILVKRRWVVERTFGWLGRYRRLSKDYEAHPDVSKAMVWCAAVRMMAQRLAYG